MYLPFIFLLDNVWFNEKRNVYGKINIQCKCSSEYKK